ncbi:unnamed protein product [Ixodes hexagonus]
MADGCDSIGGRRSVKTVSLSVSGFSDTLDWRTFLFTERAVVQRACSLCGLLFRRAVGLPCAHTLCEKCYSRRADEHCTCPLDDEVFSQDDVEEVDVALDYLLKRKVACWNVLHGCSFVGPAANLLNHYNDCEFHVVSCPRCQASVIRSGIIEHCRANCSATPRTHSHQPGEPADGQLDGIERARIEVKEALAKISDDLMSMQTRLNQCCEDVRVEGARFKLQLETQASSFTAQCNTLTELCASGFAEERQMLQQVMTTVHDTVADSGDAIIQHVSTEVGELSDKVLGATEVVSQNVLGFSGPKTLHWYVEGWESILREAQVKGGLYVEGPTRYIYGYKVSQHIQLRKDGHQIRLDCLLRFHPGENDSQLEWPFRHTCVFGIVHPKEKLKNILGRVDACTYPEYSVFQRPRGSKNVGFGAPSLSTAQGVVKGGFIQNDTLHLYVQMVP